MTQLYLFYFTFFAFGCVFGSFLNLVADRIINGESILFGRSRCDFCKKNLGPFSLIPLFSFIFQKGKSACCGEKLSMSYPISEFLTGVGFLFSAHYSNIYREVTASSVIALIYLLTIISLYIILLFTDAKYHILPDKIVYTAIFASLFFVILLSILDLKVFHDRLLEDDFGKYLLQAGFWHTRVIAVLKQLLILISSAFFISLFFISLILITKGRGMGGGDVKLGFLIGIFNGFPQNILAVFLGFLFGALYSLVLILLKKKNMKDVIAFGPFLILGSLVAFIWGSNILKWYFGLF